MSTHFTSQSLAASLPELRRKARRYLRQQKRRRASDCHDPSEGSTKGRPIAGKAVDSDNMALKSVRVLGPYENGINFRLIVIDGNRRKSVTAPTREEAQVLKKSMEGQLQTHHTRTIEEALAEYTEYCVRDHGIVALTVDEINRLIAGFLPAEASLLAITAQEAERLYRTLTERLTRRGTVIATSTHHTLLSRARAFFRWTVERGYLTQNPFAHVRPIGQKRAGKIQLTIDEARRFKQVAQQLAEAGDVAALGVLMLLLLGLRCGEVLARQARDVDDDARVLWITRGKTKNARRRLEVPEEIQESLRRLIAEKAPTDLIFGTNRAGGVRNKAYLWFKVQALCKAAGVPPVCSHSLRGLHSTLALEAGATPHLVAAALGHSSFRVTARHYAEPSTLINTRTRRLTGALTESTASSPTSKDNSSAAPKKQADMKALLESLSPEQRESLLQLLGGPSDAA